MKNIKIGDFVKVIDRMRQYSTYEDWALKNKLKKYKRGFTCGDGFQGIVTAIGKHSINSDITLIAIDSGSVEIIINIEGVEKKMKPIKKGMTEAVTRNGRKVTQLTWFECGGDYCCAGVVDGVLHVWTLDGKYYVLSKDSRDIFAPVEYEWQWLLKCNQSGKFIATIHYKDEVELYTRWNKDNYTLINRIEESKREVLTD